MLVRCHSEGETGDTRDVGRAVGGEGLAGGGEDPEVVGGEVAGDIGGGEARNNA